MSCSMADQAFDEKGTLPKDLRDAAEELNLDLEGFKVTEPICVTANNAAIKIPDHQNSAIQYGMILPPPEVIYNPVPSEGDTNFSEIFGGDGDLCEETRSVMNDASPEVQDFLKNTEDGETCNFDKNDGDVGVDTAHSGDHHISPVPLRPEPRPHDFVTASPGNLVPFDMTVCEQIEKGTSIWKFIGMYDPEIPGSERDVDNKLAVIWNDCVGQRLAIEQFAGFNDLSINKPSGVIAEKDLYEIDPSYVLTQKRLDELLEQGRQNQIDAERERVLNKSRPSVFDGLEDPSWPPETNYFTPSSGPN